MVRPSRKIDEKLLRAGAQLLAVNGAAGVSVRKVCALVGVSPGMFNYFFKSKDDFVYQVQKQIYHHLCQELGRAVEEAKDPRDRLERALVELARVSHQTRRLFLHLMRDGLNEEPAVTRMREEFVPTDLILIVKLIHECKDHGVIDERHSDVNILCLLLGSIVAPSLFGETVHECLSQHVKRLGPKSKMLSEELVRQRIAILLRGLK